MTAPRPGLAIVLVQVALIVMFMFALLAHTTHSSMFDQNFSDHWTIVLHEFRDEMFYSHPTCDALCPSKLGYSFRSCFFL